jgi:integrase
MLALKWSAVDFRTGLIAVCRSLCHSTGLVRETTKGRRIRHVPINDAIIGPLREAWRRKEKIEWVLHTNGANLDQNNIRNRRWEVDIKECGVSRIRIHDMRHTYASHFMMNGGELFKLQAILGHADIRTTMNCSHFSKAYLLENANIVRFEAEGNVIHVPFNKSETGN